MKKKHLLIFYLSVFFFSSFAKAMTDSEYERRIHGIYLKHYKDPVSNSDWNNQIQSLPREYKLKFRDNLWDLSGSFFRNSLYWSKLWVVNPTVENPHRIYKDDSLKFSVKDLLSVNTSKYSVDLQSQFPGLVIPPQESARGALTEAEIPSSLPHLLRYRFHDFEIDTGQLNPVEVYREVVVPSYLTDSPPSQDGEVISKNGYGDIVALSAEQIVVHISSEVSIGDIFTVFQKGGRVGGFFKSLVTSEEEIVIKGKVRISSYLPGGDSLYVASVVQPLEGILAGDFLFRGEPQVYSFSRSGTRGGGESGQIIGTPERGQLLLNLGSIVYLDKGLESGVQAGNLFYIRGNGEGVLGLQRPYKYDLPVVGELKIIHSSTGRSTGVIISAKDYINVGDIFTGDSGQVQDLKQSIEHEELEAPTEKPPVLNTEEQIPEGAEAIEDYEIIGDEEGKDLLIDYEEVGEGEERVDDLEDQDLKKEDEVGEELKAIDPEDIELEGEFDDAGDGDSEEEVGTNDLEGLKAIDPEDIELEGEFDDAGDGDSKEEVGTELEELEERDPEEVNLEDIELEGEFDDAGDGDSEEGVGTNELDELEERDPEEEVNLEDIELEGEFDDEGDGGLDISDEELE